MTVTILCQARLYFRLTFTVEITNVGVLSNHPLSSEAIFPTSSPTHNDGRETCVTILCQARLCFRPAVIDEPEWMDPGNHPLSSEAMFPTREMGAQE